MDTAHHNSPDGKPCLCAKDSYYRLNFVAQAFQPVPTQAKAWGYIYSAQIFWWGGRPWPPLIMAGTEARPTDICRFLKAKDS